MSLQTVKALNGKIEYVLLPIKVYNTLRSEIIKQLQYLQENDDYELFDPADYIENPVALLRIQAGITQEELATLMEVTQAYISKIENQPKITAKIIKKVTSVLNQKGK